MTDDLNEAKKMIDNFPLVQGGLWHPENPEILPALIQECIIPKIPKKPVTP